MDAKSYRFIQNLRLSNILKIAQAARTAMLHPGMRESAVSPPASPSSWEAMPLPTRAHVLGAITFMRLCTKVRICGGGHDKHSQ